jgi:hypothetical protein
MQLLPVTCAPRLGFFSKSRALITVAPPNPVSDTASIRRSAREPELLPAEALEALKPLKLSAPEVPEPVEPVEVPEAIKALELTGKTHDLVPKAIEALEPVEVPEAVDTLELPEVVKPELASELPVKTLELTTEALEPVEALEAVETLKLTAEAHDLPAESLNPAEVPKAVKALELTTEPVKAGELLPPETGEGSSEALGLSAEAGEAVELTPEPLELATEAADAARAVSEVTAADLRENEDHRPVRLVPLISPSDPAASGRLRLDGARQRQQREGP